MTGPTSFAARMKDADLVSSDVLLDGPKRFVHEVLRMPDGVDIDWYYADTKPSVMIVPITDGGDVLLVKQYRHNLRRDTLELPAGLSTPGESIDDAARRELVEETGHAVADNGFLRPLGPFYSLPSETNKYLHLYLAMPVIPVRDPEVDTEIEKYFDMSVVLMPFADAIASIGKAIHGIETVAGLLLAREAVEGQ